MHRPATLGELKSSGYRYRPVKRELRENLIARLKREEPVFPGLVGYDSTVVPQLINGILAQHDILLLGLRGQAKTRILRSLPSLLDEWIPVVSGLDVWDDPIEPQLRRTKESVHEQGDGTLIRWIHRGERYHEKLATPDVTIADLIGEIDLVKHAEGRYLADESTMHFGLIPRSNRGIFAINELPDLPPRIQVGLFNVLEERDVQIRGYPIRLNLDILLVFSANPEDYTNRGRIVTPLKDRIGTVVRTHYPFSNVDAMRITRENARLERPAGSPPLEIPAYIHEIIEEMVRLARSSPHINQQSGVSVRTSIAATEAVVANAERRALTCREPAIVPRVSDLENITAACRGKIELMLAEDEAAEDKLIRALVGEAIKNVSEQYFDLHDLEGVVAQFAGGKVNIEVGDDVPAAEVVENARKIKGLSPVAEAVKKKEATEARRHEVAQGNACAAPGPERSSGSVAPRGPASDALHLASAVEFVLEGLHVGDKLSKYLFHERTFYRQ
jgi:magnesium chelatase subunit I